MESGQTRLQTYRRRTGWAVALAACTALVAGCSSGPERDISLGNTGSTNDGAAPDYAVAYIRRTLPTPNDPNAIALVDDLRIQRVWNGPADVWLRERAAPTALEINITAQVTAGKWDVRDLDTSFDGTKIIFSMRPPLKKNAPQSEQPKWAIYEYDAPSATLRKVISDPIAADLGHDVGPHYLPDGRIVFSSTRQHDAKAVLIDEGKQQFSAGIEGNRNVPAVVLHVMNPDGSGIRQISFNTGHDLDPSVMPDGRILFTRWDIASGAGMHLYRIDPDGGNLELVYGRNSHDTGTVGSVVHFTQARARPDGRLVALLRPFRGTDFGGDLALIDPANFVENLQAVLGSAPAAGANGQARIATNDVQTIPAANGEPAPPSPGGRFSSVFPLWDGTNRMLVGWSECRLLNQGTLVPCTAKNLALPGVVSAPSLYSIWIFDPANNTQLPVVPPIEGMMLTDAVVLQPRLPTPTVLHDAMPGSPATYSFTLAAENVGILNIKSVYDFDGVDLAPGGLATVSDPARRMADPRRPRFMRIEKAVSLPDNEVLSNNALPNYAFGVAGGYMRELIGYAPVEPDGSVRVKVPANIPFQISLLDANGRRIDGLPPSGFPRHRAWLQVRTGEIVTCGGCHVQSATAQRSHGRSGLFPGVNHGATTTGVAFANTALMVKDRTGIPVPATRLPLAGETMAEYRSAVQLGCVDPACAADPALDLVFDDVWTATVSAMPDPSLAWMYANLGTPAPVRADCTSHWQGNCRGVVHYPIHVATLWSTPRTTITALDPATSAPYQACTDCHSPRDAAGVRRVSAGQLDLTSSPASAPCDQLQFTSYCQLLLPHPKLDPVTIQPILVPGPPDPVTGLPTLVTVQVTPPMSGAGANASSTFFGKFANGTAPTNCPADGPCAHTGWLTGEELKLVSEWLDLGAQYYNDPFAIPPPN
jgi:hypothetical protein